MLVPSINKFHYSTAQVILSEITRSVFDASEQKVIMRRVDSSRRMIAGCLLHNATQAPVSVFPSLHFLVPFSSDCGFSRLPHPSAKRMKLSDSLQVPTSTTVITYNFLWKSKTRLDICILFLWDMLIYIYIYQFIFLKKNIYMGVLPACIISEESIRSLSNWNYGWLCELWKSVLSPLESSQCSKLLSHLSTPYIF